MSVKASNSSSTWLNIDRDEVLAKFDALMAKNELYWAPSEPEPYNDRGIPFFFRVVPSMTIKPVFPGEPDPQKASNHETNSPSATAAKSDIDDGESAWHIVDVSDNVSVPSHRLIFNKFCIFRPQYILLTKDPSFLQTEPLRDEDFRAAWNVLKTLDEQKPHFVIFNCGKAAGSSRIHKHMQVFEVPPEVKELLPDTLSTSRTSMSGDLELDHEYFVDRHDLYNASPVEAGAALFEIYSRHLEAVARALRIEAYNTKAPPSDRPAVPHNLILTSKSIMTVPRRIAGLEGSTDVTTAATANAAGMIGLVWVPDQATIRLWKELGPVKHLATLGVPKAKSR